MTGNARTRTATTRTPATKTATAGKPDYDVVVVGGGPSGATAAHDLAVQGHRVMLLDKAGRIKPCGGAVPPRLLKDFDIPQSLLVAHAKSARIIAPSNRKVTMPVGDGYVGMVDRDIFDEWLRARAGEAGATRVEGKCEDVEDGEDGLATISFRAGRKADMKKVTARCVIGADGARSRVAQQCIPGGDRVKCVFAYHEVVKVPDQTTADYEPTRCDVYYQG
ncbi:MAG: FAD-dependent oxidoreductase, partial [Pseudomonadota bacterium]